MDADRFDSLLRAITVGSSRRGIGRALAGLGLSGVLVPPFGQTDGEARKKRKRRKRRRKNSCTPNCTNKTCGDDGCGDFCGPCIGGDCNDGTCECPPDLCSCPDGTEEECGGECVAPCPTGQIRNPIDCTCCGDIGQPCATTAQCCSSTCLVTCLGLSTGESCQFDAQCVSRSCATTCQAV